jgi:hypothetical protein
MRDNSSAKGNQPTWKRNQKLNEREKNLNERENQINQLIKKLEKYGCKIENDNQDDSDNSAEEYLFPTDLEKQWKDGLSKSKLFLPDKLATSYLLSLISGFYSGSLILLNGSVGVGKTSLVKHSANFLGGKHEIIPVRPAWLDPSDLLGFFDPIHEIFRPSPFLTALKDAEKNSNCLYLVCLDELNLAKIENYGADLLSVLEYSRNHQSDSNEQQRGLTLYSTSLVEMIWEENDNLEPLQDKPASQQAPSDKKLVQRKNNLCQYPPNFTVPNNLVLLGTLNSDETTYELSPKVIDRSYVVSYPLANLDNLDNSDIKNIFESGNLETTKISISALNNEIKQRIADGINDEHWKTIKRWNKEYLSELGIPLGYRSARDYAIFSAVADLIGLKQNNCNNKNCFGHFLFTKVLPRIFFDSSNDDKVNKCSKWLDELKKYEEFDSGNNLNRLQKQLDENRGFVRYW